MTATSSTDRNPVIGTDSQVRTVSYSKSGKVNREQTNHKVRGTRATAVTLWAHQCAVPSLAEPSPNTRLKGLRKLMRGAAKPTRRRTRSRQRHPAQPASRLSAVACARNPCRHPKTNDARRSAGETEMRRSKLIGARGRAG